MIKPRQRELNLTWTWIKKPVLASTKTLLLCHPIAWFAPAYTKKMHTTELQLGSRMSSRNQISVSNIWASSFTGLRSCNTAMSSRCQHLPFFHSLRPYCYKVLGQKSPSRSWCLKMSGHEVKGYVPWGKDAAEHWILTPCKFENVMSPLLLWFSKTQRYPFFPSLLCGFMYLKTNSFLMDEQAEL